MAGRWGVIAADTRAATGLRSGVRAPERQP
jgi:hypothetical protein